MTPEVKRKLDDIFDSSLEEPILEVEIEPDKIICPDCGGITFEGLEFCHLCGGMLVDYVLDIKQQEDKL